MSDYPPSDLLRLPQFGLTMTEALIAEWAVSAGQTVAKGDLLYVAETDKIANEVVAERAGTLDAILVAQGETVPVGTPLASWQGGDNTATTTPEMIAVRFHRRRRCSDLTAAVRRIAKTSN